MTSPTTRQVRLLAQRMLDSLLPRHCVLCGQASSSFNLCKPCHAGLPRMKFSCDLCGLPVSSDVDRACGACLRQPPPWQNAIAGMLYCFPVDQLVCRFKFGRNMACGEILGLELSCAIRDKLVEAPEVLVPVPLHRTRHFMRNFNQADLLARILAKKLSLPVQPGLLRRVRRTRAQSGLDARHRRKNLEGAFALFGIRGRTEYDHVALVDDVCTTGETLAACTRVLQQAGVSTISVWVAARAPPP